MRRRSIKAVLRSFLEVYIRRESDFDGYWVFGYLAHPPGSMIAFDLLSEPAINSSPVTPIIHAKQIAARTFAERTSRMRVPIHYITEAYLEVMTPEKQRKFWAGEHWRLGHDVEIRAVAITDLGRWYEEKITLFVAPHDPKFEHRSTRRIALQTQHPLVIWLKQFLGSE